MKNCLEAISQPRVSWETGYDLKRSFESSLEKIMDDISQELNNIISMDSKGKNTMSDFVRKAAKLWLDVGQQRYRIFLLMSQSGEKPSRSGQLNKDGKQELVAEPELRRMGNAQGERLERDELVSNCKGKFDVFCS